MVKAASMGVTGVQGNAVTINDDTYVVREGPTENRFVVVDAKGKRVGGFVVEGTAIAEYESHGLVGPRRVLAIGRLWVDEHTARGRWAGPGAAQPRSPKPDSSPLSLKRT